MKIRTCLKIAWRNLRKDGQFSVLNLAGLSIGLACTVMIYLWIADEWSVDKFNTKADGLYSAMYNIPLSDGQFFTVQSTPPPLAGALKAYPEVKDVAVIHAPDNDDGPKGVLSVNGKRIKSGELFVTPNFLRSVFFQGIGREYAGDAGCGRDMEGDVLGNGSGGGGIDWRGKKQSIEFSGFYIDYGIMDLLGMKMAAGRPFSPAFATDSDGVVFNQTAVAMMGLKDPIGKPVKFWGQQKHIIGW